MLFGVAFGFLGLYVYQKYSPKIIPRVERITDKNFIPGKLRRIIISLFKQLAKSLEILRDWREGVSVSFWTALRRIGRTSITVDVTVETEREGESRLLTQAAVTYVCVDLSGDERKPVSIRNGIAP